MTSEAFAALIKKDSYQVFIFGSPANLPFSFITHSWFVLNKQGAVSRWEVLFTKKASSSSWGHLFKNIRAPVQGLRLLPFMGSVRWRARLLSVIEGEAAQQIIEFIEKSAEKYPYCHRYSLVGPNSNTYVQWTLDQFPQWKFTLPWNAFGKGFEGRT